MEQDGDARGLARVLLRATNHFCPSTGVPDCWTPCLPWPKARAASATRSAACPNIGSSCHGLMGGGRCRSRRSMPRDRICIVRSRARATTGPSHGARPTWPHGGAPAPTAPHARDGEMAASGCRIRGAKSFGRDPRADLGRISRSADLWLQQLSCSAAAGTHVRFQLFLITFFFTLKQTHSTWCITDGNWWIRID